MNLFNLTGPALGSALSQLSGEAATGAQQGAFQLTNQFLGTHARPVRRWAQRRRRRRQPAIGFAPEREALPAEIALAYASVLKAPAKAPAFEQRWSVWGASLRRLQSHHRRPGGGRQPRSHRAHGGLRSRARLSGRARHVVGFALAGGGTNWGLADGLGTGKSDAFQAGVYGTTRAGPVYIAAALAYTRHG